MDINKPDYKLFQKNYNAGKDQIIFLSFAADVHTPVSALIKLKKVCFLKHVSKTQTTGLTPYL